MLQPEINSAVIITIIFFALGMLAILKVYGAEMWNNRWAEDEYAEGIITSRDVSKYFSEQGYDVQYVSPVKDTSDWVAFLEKDNIVQVVTVLTDDEVITGYQNHSTAQ